MPASRSIYCLICDQRKSESTYSFHRFPKSEMIKMKWIEWCSDNGLMRPNDDTMNVYLCGRHFSSSSFNGKKRHILKRGAVPCHVHGLKVLMETVKPAYQPRMPNEYTGRDKIIGTVVSSDVRSKSCDSDSTDSAKSRGDVPSGVPEEISMETNISDLLLAELPSLNTSTECAGLTRKRHFRYLNDFRSKDMENADKAKKFRLVALRLVAAKSQQIDLIKRCNNQLIKQVSKLKEQLLKLKEK